MLIAEALRSRALPLLDRMMFKFCSECKGNLKKDLANLLICQTCGFRFYINPKPVANLILENEEGKILLVKRKFPPKRGFWDLPGGFVDLRESLEQALAREIKEELGIPLGQPKYFGSYIERYLYKGKNYHLLVTIFTDTQDHPIINIGDDAADFAFFNVDNIPYKTMCCESDSQAIRDFFNQKYHEHSHLDNK